MDANNVKQARDMATPYGQSVANDTTGLMVVQYIPSLGEGSAAAECAVTAATDFTFLTGAAGAAAAPTGNDAIGTAGVILFSGYATFGALVDYINSFQAWRAYLTGALRADPTALAPLVKSTTTCINDEGLTIFGDTSACDHASVTISGEKFVNNGIGGHVKDWDDQCENRLMEYTYNIDQAAAGTLVIYAGKQGSTETAIHSIASTDATLTSAGTTIANGGYYKMATRGHRLILRIAQTTVTTVTQFDVTGSTAVLDGSRVVVEGPNP